MIKARLRAEVSPFWLSGVESQSKSQYMHICVVPGARREGTPAAAARRASPSFYEGDYLASFYEDQLVERPVLEGAVGQVAADSERDLFLAQFLVGDLQRVCGAPTTAGGGR